ncbi:hypothetical protein F4779DRAFT_112336 [Xylariaceae sp. FL0662B]|nr:hypothetical protein F4779DRAFT_112336 [Xylariaceae sp. FL0662B]
MFSPNGNQTPPRRTSDHPVDESTFRSTRQASNPQNQPQLSSLAAVHTTPLFPPAWCLYRLQNFRGVLMLGAPETGPLYAISQHSGWAGGPHIVLHNGPSEGLPALAAVIRRTSLREKSIVSLPPMPGSGAGPSQEKCRTRPWRLRVIFRFAVEVGADPHLWKREAFEWRRSSGDAVASLCIGGVTRGWKLVRLAPGSSAPPRSMSDPSVSSAQTSNVSNDGHEVVAVWADTKGDLTQAMRFRFLGSGEAGTLGDRWAIMAVMTALHIFQWQQIINSVW